MSIGSVSFGQRPTGYTVEKKSHKVRNTALTVAGLGVAATGVYFVTKGKKIGEIKKLFEIVTEEAKNFYNKIRKYFPKSKKQVKPQTNHTEPDNAPKPKNETKTFNQVFAYREAEKEAEATAARFADYDKAAAEAGIDIL